MAVITIAINDVNKLTPIFEGHKATTKINQQYLKVL
jgi:hypothetical protein